MDKLQNFLGRLGEEVIVLDLGCGYGSFHYAACNCHVIAMDVSLPENGAGSTASRVKYVRADSKAIPLDNESVDAVICHHTLEHFADYRMTLSEIGRVLRANGWLWIAIPDGNGFDDALYRLVFSGGGHVNRFSYEGLVAEVQSITGLRLAQSCLLFSGFVYLKKPTPRELQHFPPTARFLAEVPDGFSVFGRVAVNTATRIIDRLFGSRYSQYGWAFLFTKTTIAMDALPSYFNVCRQCGSGNSAESVKACSAGPSLFGFRLYHCPHCAEVNVFVPPPRNLQ
ncbi:MAG TPA: class I SAM-dependent methyltransferase [Terriglobia bacterium]|nr:class I SAM-dependent methyltransferase [Terriglobia bacterium]